MRCYRLPCYGTLAKTTPATDIALQIAFYSALDTIHQVLILYAFYYYLILNFDNPIALLEMFW